jgi:DNA-binding transcriptional LysR family regulator
MKIEQLRQIVAIEQYKSISRASKELYIGQPTLSSSLNSLEKELGTQIFVRTSQGVKPTEDGKQVLQIAHQIVNGCDLLLNYRNDNDPKKMTGTIKVSLSPVYGYLYFDIAARYRECFPQVDLQLRVYSPNHMKEAFRCGECNIAIELGLDKLMAMVQDEKFSYEKLKVHKAMLFAGPKSRFYERKSVSIDELQEEQFVAYSAEYWGAKSKLMNIKSAPIFMEDFSSIWNAIYRTDVVGILPDTIDKVELNQYEGRPKMIPIEDAEDLITNGIILYAGNRQLTLLEQQTIQFLKKIMKELE